MYAVIATGGKQYRVSEGAVLRVEKLDAEEGASVEFDQVLLVGDGDKVSVGKPFIEGGKVQATVLLSRAQQNSSKATTQLRHEGGLSSRPEASKRR